MDGMNEKSWFSRVETKSEAPVEVDRASNGFYLIAAMYLISAFLSDYVSAVFGVILIAMSTWLRMRKARGAALALLVLSVGMLAYNLIMLAYFNWPTGKGIVLNGIMLWVSYRALAATSLLRA